MRIILLIAFFISMGLASNAQTSGTSTLNIVLSDVQSVKFIKNEMPIKTNTSGILSSSPDLSILDTIRYEIRKLDLKAQPAGNKRAEELLVAQAGASRGYLRNSKTPAVLPNIPHHIYQINPR